MTDANKSLNECNASDNILTEPVKRLATILSKISNEFEIMEIIAARDALYVELIICI